MMVSSRFRSIAFPVALVVVLVAHAVVVAAGFFHTRVWEDEAYNLTVPLNLLAGLGYSSDGYLTGNQLDPFDVRISTGPVVLLPIAAVLATGIDVVVGARLVMALFWILLLVALWLVGRRMAGRWGGLLAVAVPLALDGGGNNSPIQGPTDVLGEVPVAAFLVLAILFVRSRPVLSGLMVGLAIAAKNLAILGVPVLGLAVLFAVAGISWHARLVRGVVFAAAAVLPQALFEVFKLLSLGRSEYLRSTQELYDFLRSGGQPGQGTGRGEKLSVLVDSWFVPGWAVVVVALIAAGLVVAAALVHRRSRERPDQALLAEALTAAGLLAVWTAWWLASSGNPAWIRHPAPALLAAVPILAVVALRAARRLLREGRSVRPLAVVGVAAIVLAAAVPLVTHAQATYSPTWETLGQQREAAADARADDVSDLATPWGPVVPLGVLGGTDVLVGPLDDFEDLPDDSVIVTVPWVEWSGCEPTRIEVGDYAVCDPASAP